MGNFSNPMNLTLQSNHLLGLLLNNNDDRFVEQNGKIVQFVGCASNTLQSNDHPKVLIFENSISNQ